MSALWQTSMRITHDGATALKGNPRSVSSQDRGEMKWSTTLKGDPSVSSENKGEMKWSVNHQLVAVFFLFFLF